MIEEHRPQGRLALAIAQERDPVAALRAGAGIALDHAHDVILGPIDRRLRAVAFDHQHIAVRQGEDRARMLEAGGERGDLKARRDGRLLPVMPSFRRRDMHGRQEIFLRLRQFGMRAILRQVGRLLARPDGKDGGGRAQEAKRGAGHGRASVAAERSQPQRPTAMRRTAATADSATPLGTTAV